MYNFMYGKDYWVAAGRTNPMHEICTGFTPEEFREREEGVWFGFNLEKYTNREKTIFAEIGCGLGRISHWVAPHVKQYNGIDISHTMVSGAVEYNKQFGFNNCKFFESTNLSETFGKESLDMVYTELVFIHISKDEQINYINDAYNSLKNGGLCALQIPSCESYLNGFSDLELENILSKFKILQKTQNKYLYTFLCEK